MLKQILDIVQTNISNKPDQESYIIKFPFDVSSKGISDAIKGISSSKDRKLNSKSIYLFGVEAAEGRVNHGCYIAAVGVYQLWSDADNDVHRIRSQRASSVLSGLAVLRRRSEERRVARAQRPRASETSPTRLTLAWRPLLRWVEAQTRWQLLTISSISRS
jgi:hypothetical protein